MLPATTTQSLVRYRTQRFENQVPGSEFEEARNLVRNCAEPRPVGDSSKAAVNRAAKRLGFSVSRTKDIWYGHAARINAKEMDRLRTVAFTTDIDQGIAALGVLRARLCTMPASVVRKAIEGIDVVLGTLLPADDAEAA
jgi:hypothetical protein